MSGLIKVIKFQGKNGGFATSDSTLYRVDVVGEDGSIKQGNAYPNSQYADKDARIWEAFTNWPVLFFEATKRVVEVETEVKHF